MKHDQATGEVNSIDQLPKWVNKELLDIIKITELIRKNIKYSKIVEVAEITKKGRGRKI